MYKEVENKSLSNLDDLEFIEINSAIIESIWSNDLEKLKLLIAKVDSDDLELIMDEYTAKSMLVIAAGLGYLDIVKYLIEEVNVDINQGDIAGESPLWVAACRGNLAVVNYLLGKNKLLVNQPNKYAITPIGAAARNNHTQVVERLLHHVSLDKKMINSLYHSMNTSSVFKFCMLFDLDKIENIFEYFSSEHKDIDPEKQESIRFLLDIKCRYNLNYEHMLFLLNPENQAQLALLDTLEKNSHLQNLPEIWHEIISHAYDDVIKPSDYINLINAYRDRHKHNQMASDGINIMQPFFDQGDQTNPHSHDNDHSTT
ncbi:ankyrin repeat domain-containing protein [Thiotrichales bacterium 19S3-7]|nr:ankyrin repeat domain-containing protein [Thiotrichales bacterium 19S3-7]MCF6802413.1 ankyrin repeat domain-containing protein [Thiotrichales bacterium 19S3-11]